MFAPFGAGKSPPKIDENDQFKLPDRSFGANLGSSDLRNYGRAKQKHCYNFTDPMTNVTTRVSRAKHLWDRQSLDLLIGHACVLNGYDCHIHHVSKFKSWGGSLFRDVKAGITIKMKPYHARIEVTDHDGLQG